jgi:serine/threonine-protein kinase
MIGAAAVVAALSVGLVGGWLYVRSQVPSHVVPTSLVGMQQTQLAAEVGGFGWTIELEEVRQDGTDPGEIVATRPEGGTDLREGETLVVVVSQGGPLVDVPDGLAGMTSDDAVEALEEVGLVPRLVPQRSEQVDDGLIIGFAEGDPGPQAPKGTTIALAVSTGDEIEVPQLSGRPYEEAVAELERLGLSVELEGDEPDGGDFAVGEVMGTEPEAGDEVDPGDTVVVIVAVDQVHVPTVGGMTLDEATQAIEGEGLSVGRVRGPDDGRVFLTWPLEGSEVEAGSSVDLVMRPD